MMHSTVPDENGKGSPPTIGEVPASEGGTGGQPSGRDSGPGGQAHASGRLHLQAPFAAHCGCAHRNIKAWLGGRRWSSAHQLSVVSFPATALTASINGRADLVVRLIWRIFFMDFIRDGFVGRLPKANARIAFT
jgi:hypothetical protein